MAEMGTVRDHVVRLHREVQLSYAFLSKCLWLNFNVTKRLLSQAEGERGHFVIFQENFNKLLSKEASGRTRKSLTPALAEGNVYVFEESSSDKP